MTKAKTSTAHTELRSLADLRPASYNPRRISKRAAKGLAASLRRFGDISGLVWNQRTGHLVCGHQRLAALRAEHGDKLRLVNGAVIGGDKFFPVRVVDWEEPFEKAANVAANSVEISGEFTAALEDLLVEVKDFDAELFGELLLDEIDLSGLVDETATSGEDPDDVPEPPKTPITKPGDLYLLGKHRLLCGDSTKADDVARVMGGEKIRTVITSPPYFNARDYAHWNTVEQYINDMSIVVSLAADCADDLCIVWNIGEQAVRRLDLSSITSVAFSKITGLEFRDKIAWIKPGAAFDIPRNGHIIKGYYYPAFSWEPLLVFTRGRHPVIDSRYRKELSKDPTDTWHIESVASQNESKGHHCAAFPVDLAVKCVKCYSPVETIIFDPFLGSGTTIIAAEQLGRRCYGLEISPAYCDICIQRWETFTGKKAERAK